jgi:hypothetical protein
MAILYVLNTGDTAKILPVSITVPNTGKPVSVKPVLETVIGYLE